MLLRNIITKAQNQQIVQFRNINMKHKLIINDNAPKSTIDIFTDHINSLKPIPKSIFDKSEIIEFKSLDNLIDDEFTCRMIYLLLQEEHISSWIQSFASIDNYEFEEIVPNCVKLKHKSYDNYYLFWHNQLLIDSYDYKGECYGNGHHIDTRISKYLVDQGYIIPLLYLTDKPRRIGRMTFTVYEILKSFKNIKLIK
jgi:hypothetical protein